MAFAAASGFPTRFFPNFTYTTLGGSGGVFIPYANLESFSASNSGEVGEFLYSVVDKVASGILVLPSDDRPTRYRITRATSSTGDTTVQKTYNVSFDLNAKNTVYDVQSE
jgi:hypothetical protein